MRTTEDAERRYAQISGERDYHKRRTANLEQQRDALAEALRKIDDDLEGRNFLENSSLRDTARAALKQMENNQ